MDRRRMMMASGREPEIERDWLKFDILTAGTVLWKCATDKERTISYRKNGKKWTKITSTTSGVSISVAKNDVLEFKGNNADYGGARNTSGQGSYFAGTATFNASGDISTMLNNSETLPATLALAHLFHGAKVVSAEDLILPYTSLTKNCYYCMFYGCTSLTTAPELPATTLASYCYASMFRGCTSLVNIPNKLPATTLASYCYGYMFYGCSKIIEAPYLPATKLVSNCYASMFYNCSKLQYIKTNFSTTPSNTYTKTWVTGVAAKGIFDKNGKTWSVTGVNGVPTGWGDYPGLALLIQTSGNIIWKGGANYNGANLWLSRDYGVTWNNFRSTTSGVSISVSAGEVICLGTYEERLANAASLDNCHTLNSTATFSAVGKIKSMVDGDNSVFDEQIYNFDLPLPNYPYSLYAIFYQNTGIVSARHLEMPSNVTNYCYSRMFYGCTNLKCPPKLPATTLAYYCYQYMFYNCTNLTTAPELPATTLTESCYYGMFYGCTNLSSITCLATDISARNCTTNWVLTVASSGTFTKAASMSGWTTGNNGIPSGWDVVDYEE